MYRSGAEFHREYLSVVFARADPVWCPEWQKHAEAREVVDALWRSWEDAQAQPHDGWPAGSPTTATRSCAN